MTRKNHIIVGLLVVLSILGMYFIFSNSKYQEVSPPQLSAGNPKDLLIKVLESEEYFSGSVEYKFMDLDQSTLEIRMINNSVGDDSIKVADNIFYAKKIGEQWKITSKKIRVICRGSLFNSWTTGGCS